MVDATNEEVKKDEEQVVKDNDANTADVVDTVKDENSEENYNYSKMLDFMQEMRARMDSVDASIRSIKDAQSITIDNGAVIRDDSEQVEDDDFIDTRSIAQLDLTL